MQSGKGAEKRSLWRASWVWGGGMSKVATDCLRVFIECQRNYYIHANPWIVQGWRSKARLKTPWQSNSGIQCIHDHPWTVQGWPSKARLKTPWQSNSGIQCIHDHPWTVQGWHIVARLKTPWQSNSGIQIVLTFMKHVSTTIHGRSKDGIVARLKTPWQSNSGIQCIHDHPWTVQGWHSSQAQDPLAK